jgi:hypothetical protein
MQGLSAQEQPVRTSLWQAAHLSRLQPSGVGKALHPSAAGTTVADTGSHMPCRGDGLGGGQLACPICAHCPEH